MQVFTVGASAEGDAEAPQSSSRCASTSGRTSLGWVLEWTVLLGPTDFALLTDTRHMHTYFLPEYDFALIFTNLQPKFDAGRQRSGTSWKDELPLSHTGGAPRRENALQADMQ